MTSVSSDGKPEHNNEPASPVSLNRLYLLDWFGRLIDHDTLRDEPVRRPFESGHQPGLFLLAVTPLQLPSSALLRKRTPLPRAYPDIQLIDARDGFIGLFLKGMNSWFSIHAESEKTCLGAPRLLDWERFTLLTQPMLDGLGILAHASHGRISDENGQTVAPLRFADLEAGGGWLEEAIFIPAQNAEALQAVGSLRSGETGRFKFKTQNGPDKTLVEKTYLVTHL